MTKKANNAPETALVLRTCNADMTSTNGFPWPKKGPVECPDWKPTKACGNGLHGLLWGEGDAGLVSQDENAKAVIYGSATAGNYGSATAGEDGIVVILHWNGKRYKPVVGAIGDDELLPNVAYRLDEDGKFVRADGAS